jgi:hypothetical protein
MDATRLEESDLRKPTELKVDDRFDASVSRFEAIRHACDG